MFRRKVRAAPIGKKQRLYATLGSRLMAFAVDIIVYMVIFLPFMWLLNVVNPQTPLMKQPIDIMQMTEWEDLSGEEHIRVDEAETMPVSTISDYVEVEGGWIRVVLGQLAQISLLLLLGAWCHFRYGATPGEWLFSIRVVDAKGRPALSLAQSLCREFATILSVLPLTLGIFSMCFHRQRQMWHDRIAGTVVVRR